MQAGFVGERSSGTVKIVVIAETHQGERRVALVPDIAAKLVASGFEVFVEADAGEQAGFTDGAIYGPHNDHRRRDMLSFPDRQKLVGAGRNEPRPAPSLIDARSNTHHSKKKIAP